MHWDGQIFPAVEVEYSDGTRQLTPESTVMELLSLPHHHKDIDRAFPKAVAVTANMEVDEIPDMFETRGEALGRSLPPR